MKQTEWMRQAKTIKRVWRTAFVLLVSIVFCFEATAAPVRCSDIFSTFFHGQKETVTSTIEMLNQLEANAGKEFRSNPKHVELKSLEVGKEYYVTPSAFRGYSSLSKVVKEPLRMKIVQINESPTHRNWKRAVRAVYLESPQTGRVAIESWRLYGEIYSERDFSQYAPFEIGEYVQIGADYLSSNVYKTVANPENTFTFSGSVLVFIGKFIRNYDQNHYVVQVRSIEHNHPELIVPTFLTIGLRSGTVTHFRNAVKNLLSMNIAFKSDELVRFRNSDGKIELGIFVRSNDKYITLKNQLGRTVYVSSQSVFRYIEGEPHTAIYNADWIQAHFPNPTDLVRQFLDGAGKLTSLPDFAEMSIEQKVLTLMKYLNFNVKWTKGAMTAEFAGLQDFNEILCAGAGVCRHLSVLMATMLSELGYVTRLTKYIEDNKDGHAWVEFDVRTPDGQSKTFVTDPSFTGFVKSLNEVFATATKERNSMEARWYTKPGRTFLTVFPNF